MTIDSYIPRLKSILADFDPKGRNRYFLFGSSTRRQKGAVGDVDIAVVGASKSDTDVAKLKEHIESTTFPFFVDVVDFDAAQESFRNFVNDNETIIWMN